MKLESMLPGATWSLRAIAMTGVALLVAAYLAGHCAGVRSVNTSELERAVKAQHDTIQADKVASAQLVDAAASAHAEASRAAARLTLAHQAAESATTAAERWRTFRIRVIDSTHVGVTNSDTQHVEEVREVPVEATVALQLDSIALRAKDIELDRVHALLDAKNLEIQKLWQAVASDSLTIRHQDEAIADLTKLAKAKGPRCQAKCGAALTITALVALDAAKRALTSLLKGIRL